jgi:hypothetical protein
VGSRQPAARGAWVALPRGSPRQEHPAPPGRATRGHRLEHAKLGDPAYDLAIVTRGVRQPFQVGQGLERLLDAYAAHAARRIIACDVHLYELCIVGLWYRAAIAGASDREPPEQALGRVRNVLTRARAAEAREHTVSVVSPPT